MDSEPPKWILRQRSDEEEMVVCKRRAGWSVQMAARSQAGANGRINCALHVHVQVLSVLGFLATDTFQGERIDRSGIISSHYL